MAANQEIEEVIRDSLRDFLGSSFFKDYYIGDPGQIPASSLPCIMVFRRNTSYDRLTTAHDERTIDVMVRVALNHRTDFGKPGTESLTHAKIRTIVEGEDATGSLDDTSIVGILRTQLTQGGRLVGNVAEITYPDPRERGREITTECDIVLRLQRLSLVPVTY